MLSDLFHASGLSALWYFFPNWFIHDYFSWVLPTAFYLSNAIHNVICMLSPVALGALKRKKRYEKQLQQIDGTLSTIEMQREALESANTNTNVLQTMGDAAKALKRAHQDMDVDKVHDMMDDIADQQDVAREISEAISNPVAFGQDVDEVRYGFSL